MEMKANLFIDNIAHIQKKKKPYHSFITGFNPVRRGKK